MNLYSNRFKKYINEVFSITPNDLGFDSLTFWFKKITFLLKNIPFLLLIPLTLTFALLLHFIFGKYLVWLTSFLQYGF
jgi:hypothetical protein